MTRRIVSSAVASEPHLARERAARLEAERIAEDVTRELYEKVQELKRSRADLARWAEHLEARLAEHVRDLEDRNRRLEEFARTVSHDLQAPLTSALLRVAILQRKNTFDPKDVEVIRRSLQKMGDLIRTLLDNARDTEGPADDIVDLAEVCHEVAEILPPGLLDVRCLQVGDLPMLRANRVRIQQLFQNLLTNAAKYSADERHPKVEVFAEVQDEAILIHVRDNGIGFEPGVAEALFEPGYRRASDRPGHGIGLATCKHIVQELGGTISAAGRPDEGATFTICLPAARLVAVDEEQG